MAARTFFALGQVAGRGHPLPRGGGGRRVHGVDVVVLVAGLILREEDELAVPAPEIAGDRALGVGGEGPGLLERLPRTLDPDVARAVERLDERDELAVG
jgi:hypothetical protein